MDDGLLKFNEELKAEADELLYKKGLFDLLQKYGTPHVSGSYNLNLMTWRDLDIYLETAEHSERDFFTLAFDISSSLRPVKMNFRNELITQTKGLPIGLYWGVYLGNERAGAWKIDIWSVTSGECKRLLEYCAAIKSKVTSATAIQILKIKSQCWSDPLYRKSYNSGDIYTAVLEKDIYTIGAFREFLQTRNN